MCQRGCYRKLTEESDHGVRVKAVGNPRVGVVLFGLFSRVGDHRLALFYGGFLFLPAGIISFLMPKVKD